MLGARGADVLVSILIYLVIADGHRESNQEACQGPIKHTPPPHTHIEEAERALGLPRFPPPQRAAWTADAA